MHKVSSIEQSVAAIAIAVAVAVVIMTVVANPAEVIAADAVFKWRHGPEQRAKGQNCLRRLFLLRV